MLDGFSAHADQKGLLDFAEAVRERGPLRRVLLVHGEPRAQEVLARELEARGFPSVHAPAPGERAAAVNPAAPSTQRLRAVDEVAPNVRDSSERRVAKRGQSGWHVVRTKERHGIETRPALRIRRCSHDRVCSHASRARG